ncbi:MAG: CotH kinase family protein [Defluviitaleaceae bacterium]|nr:CotH kinase family protein [Defluviitaleaceae bacterium]
MKNKFHEFICAEGMSKKMKKVLAVSLAIILVLGLLTPFNLLAEYGAEEPPNYYLEYEYGYVKNGENGESIDENIDAYDGLAGDDSAASDYLPVTSTAAPANLTLPYGHISVWNMDYNMSNWQDWTSPVGNVSISAINGTLFTEIAPFAGEPPAPQSWGPGFDIFPANLGLALGDTVQIAFAVPEIDHAERVRLIQPAIWRLIDNPATMVPGGIKVFNFIVDNYFSFDHAIRIGRDDNLDDGNFYITGILVSRPGGNAVTGPWESILNSAYFGQRGAVSLSANNYGITVSNRGTNNHDHNNGIAIDITGLRTRAGNPGATIVVSGTASPTDSAIQVRGTSTGSPIAQDGSFAVVFNDTVTAYTIAEWNASNEWGWNGHEWGLPQSSGNVRVPFFATALNPYEVSGASQPYTITGITIDGICIFEVIQTTPPPESYLRIHRRTRAWQGVDIDFSEIPGVNLHENSYNIEITGFVPSGTGNAVTVREPFLGVNNVWDREVPHARQTNGEEFTMSIAGVNEAFFAPPHDNRMTGGAARRLRINTGILVDEFIITNIVISEGNNEIWSLAENALPAAGPGELGLVGMDYFAGLWAASNVGEAGFYVVGPAIPGTPPAVPTFSHNPGFHPAAFDLTISAPSGTVIRYTTDGSVPNRFSPVLTGAVHINTPPITPENTLMSQHAVGWASEGPWRNDFQPRPVYNGTVIRARAFNADGLGSETATGTFFINSEFENIRTLSLTMDAYQFIHEIYGMYHNWGPRGEAYDPRLTPWPYFDWVGSRQVVNVEMFADGEIIASQEANAWVMGQFSRRHAKRSLRFNFHQGDGEIRGELNFIPETRMNFYEPTNIENFRHLNARLSEQHSTGIRDSIVHLLSEPLRPTIQNSVYGAVFVNGEFWGMYDLRTHRHEALLRELFNVPSGDIWMNNSHYNWTNAHRIYVIARESVNRANNPAFPQYTDTLDYFATRVCVDDWIDYLITGFHFGNWDWIGNNFEYWRTTSVLPGIHGADGRYRFIVQDFDHSIGAQQGINGFRDNMLSDFVHVDNDWRRPYWVAELINISFANEDFRNTFAARYSTYTGTVFNPELTVHVLNQMEEERLSTFGMNSYRWRLHNATSPEVGLQNWRNNQIAPMRTWMQYRTNYTVGHIREHLNRTDQPGLGLNLDETGLTTIWWSTCYFSQPETTRVDRGWLDISGAQIRPDLFQRQGLHGFYIGGFNAQYIRGLPVTVTAVPMHGYAFSHFEIQDWCNVTNAHLGAATTIYQNPHIFTPPANVGANVDIAVNAVFTTASPHDITVNSWCNTEETIINTGASATPASAIAGTVITIDAGTAPAGYRFTRWYGYAAFQDAYSPTTTFVMPNYDVVLYAGFSEVREATGMVGRITPTTNWGSLEVNLPLTDAAYTVSFLIFANEPLYSSVWVQPNYRSAPGPGAPWNFDDGINSLTDIPITRGEWNEITFTFYGYQTDNGLRITTSFPRLQGIPFWVDDIVIRNSAGDIIFEYDFDYVFGDFAALSAGSVSGAGGVLDIVHASDVGRLAPQVLINQVHGGGNVSSNAASHSFIELYNPTGDEVYLGNFTLQVQNPGDPAAAPPVYWDVLSLTGYYIQPHSSFLIVSSQGILIPGRRAVTNPDIYWNQEFGNRALAVALVRGEYALPPFITYAADWARVADLVGAFNSAPPRDRVDNYLVSPARISRSEGIRRVDFHDTRNNAADFVGVRYLEISDAQWQELRPRSSYDGPWGIVSAEPSLLINQVYAQGDPGTNSVSHGFIEIFNPTNAPVYLGEMSLQIQMNPYDGRTDLANTLIPTEWQVFNLPSRYIQPGGFFLVVNHTWDSPSPRLTITNYDARWESVEFNNRNISVALVSNQIRLSPIISTAEMAYVTDLVGAYNDGPPRDRVHNYLGTPNQGLSRQVASRRINFQNTENNRDDFTAIDFRYPAGGYANATPGVATHANGITNAELLEVGPRFSGGLAWGGSLSVETLNAAAGENVTLAVRISDNPGFAAMAFRIDFPSNLTLNNINYDDSAFPGLISASIRGGGTYGYVIFNDASNWYGNGALVYLSFTAAASASPGLNAVTLTFANYRGGDDYPVTYEGVPVNILRMPGGVYIPNTNCPFCQNADHTPILGDINGDGRVTSLDVTWLMRWLNGDDVNICLAAADFGGNGITAPADVPLHYVTRLARWLVGLHDDLAVGAD